MPCLSIRVSDWVDEHGECGECGAMHAAMVSSTAAAAVESTGFCCSTASLVQMMSAVKVLLQGIGEDVGREGLLKTPLRVASAFRGAIAGYQFTAEEIIGPALFSEAGTGGGNGCGGGSGGLVVVRNIQTFALCESCLLPFRLRCHVVYIPCGQRVVGLSKFPRVAEIFAKRLQNPQKFADTFVQALNESFQPLGVGVVVESWHLQWPGVGEGSARLTGNRGEERLGFGWVPTTVYAGKGQFEDLHCGLWDEFLTILQLDDVEIENHALGAPDGHYGRRNSCPFLVYDGQGLPSRNLISTVPDIFCNGSTAQNSFTVSTLSASAATMAIGVEALLRAMGEDPSKEELRCTAMRFVNWLLSATQGSRVATVNIHESLSTNGANGTAVCTNNGPFSHGNGSLSNVECTDNGSLSCGNGSLSNGGSTGVKGSVNGCVTLSNGLGHGIRSMGNGIENLNSSLTNGVGHGNNSFAQSHGNSLVKEGLLVNGGIALNHQPETGFQTCSNGALRYVNGTVGESKSATSNGRCSSKVDSLSEVEDLVCLELDMPFSSLCEHHLLPFFGIVHLSYIRGKGSRPIDRSVVMKIVTMYSRRLQAQERLTRQIVEAVVAVGGALQGAMVVAEASHMCIMSRGVEKLGSSTATVATIGKFSTDGTMRAAFLKRISRKPAKKMSD